MFFTVGRAALTTGRRSALSTVNTHSYGNTACWVLPVIPRDQCGNLSLTPSRLSRVAPIVKINSLYISNPAQRQSGATWLSSNPLLSLLLPATLAKSHPVLSYQTNPIDSHICDLPLSLSPLSTLWLYNPSKPTPSLPQATMPARTRHSLASTTEVAEPEEEPSGLRRLRFNETLSWRAGRAIPVADLLERLESLALELRQLDQEETDKDSLKKVSQDLASGHLLGHRDKGVRAWTACCVVDILRLCAPNAPFTGNQLKVRRCELK